MWKVRSPYPTATDASRTQYTATTRSMKLALATCFRMMASPVISTERRSGIWWWLDFAVHRNSSWGSALRDGQRSSQVDLMWSMRVAGYSSRHFSLVWSGRGLAGSVVMRGALELQLSEAGSCHRRREAILFSLSQKVCCTSVTADNKKLKSQNPES